MPRHNVRGEHARASNLCSSSTNERGKAVIGDHFESPSSRQGIGVASHPSWRELDQRIRGKERYDDSEFN